MKYSKKLRDPRWQKKRLEVMQRDDFTCLACGCKDSTLNVHHKQYHGNPWDAPMSSLETLCEWCHEKRTRLNKIALGMSTKRFFEFSSKFEESDFCIKLRELWPAILDDYKLRFSDYGIKSVKSLELVGVDEHDYVITVHFDRKDYDGGFDVGKYLSSSIYDVANSSNWVEALPRVTE
jgi:hypothetical protein